MNASPLTISLPSSSYQSTHTDPTFADDNTNVDRFSTVVECKIVHCIKTGTEHEKMIQGNAWRNDTNGHLKVEDKIDGIKQDPRIADIIAAGIPRREFADCLINDSELEGGKANGDEVGKEREKLRRKQQEELIAKGSLMVLLENWAPRNSPCVSKMPIKCSYSARELVVWCLDRRWRSKSPPMSIKNHISTRSAAHVTCDRKNLAIISAYIIIATQWSSQKAALSRPFLSCNTYISFNKLSALQHT